MEDNGHVTKEDMQLVEYKENLIKKIFKKLLKLFGIDKKKSI